MRHSEQETAVEQEGGGEAIAAILAGYTTMVSSN